MSDLRPWAIIPFPGTRTASCAGLGSTKWVAPQGQQQVGRTPRSFAAENRPGSLSTAGIKPKKARRGCPKWTLRKRPEEARRGRKRPEEARRGRKRLEEAGRG